MGDETAVYKLENKAIAGEMKFRSEGIGYNKPVNDSMDAAFQQFKQHAARLASGMRINAKDYLLYYNDIQSKGLSAELSLAEFIGLCSAAANRPVMPALAVPGILRISGTLEPIGNLEDIMRVAKNAGARRILLPMSSIADLQNIAPELIGSVSAEFYETGNAVAAARKALDL